MPSFSLRVWSSLGSVARLLSGLSLLAAAGCAEDASSVETRTGTTLPQDGKGAGEPTADEPGASDPGESDDASGDGDGDDNTQTPDGEAGDDAGAEPPDDGSNGDGDGDGDAPDTPSDCTPGGQGLSIDGELVLDRKTCLTWQRAEPTQPVYCEANERNPMGYCWTAAALYCDDLELQGASDFRLPSQAELLTIVDKTQFPTADKAAFPDVRQQFYWTSREVNPDHAWCIDFGSGNPSPSAAKWGGQAFRCVRGPAIAEKP